MLNSVRASPVVQYFHSFRLMPFIHSVGNACPGPTCPALSPGGLLRLEVTLI
jgi:hypothetical protein